MRGDLFKVARTFPRVGQPRSYCRVACSVRPLESPEEIGREQRACWLCDDTISYFLNMPCPVVASDLRREDAGRERKLTSIRDLVRQAAEETVDGLRLRVHGVRWGEVKSEEDVDQPGGERAVASSFERSNALVLSYPT